MKVASILKLKGTNVETTSPDTKLYTVVWDLRLKGIGALVVTEDGTPAGHVHGIISERDVVRGLAEHGNGLLGLPVSRLMTAPVITCRADDSIAAVMARMTAHRIRHLPVVDEGGRLSGIISIGDVVKHRVDELEMETNILRETLIAHH